MSDLLAVPDVLLVLVEPDFFASVLSAEGLTSLLGCSLASPKPPFPALISAETSSLLVVLSALLLLELIGLPEPGLFPAWLPEGRLEEEELVEEADVFFCSFSMAGWGY
ncbi:hypothetical protein J7E24_16500 [Hymenobacter sp. ISL-91]|uniref:hypothetical protein n=1 Tax=Hymenobacter sp. ISL-91 TaxID=2819151 RepID=UPI001BE52F77|nr:hypothetical protein [Hymenobacter sp. ISL-91]MBT2559391.1 hypothetical protein [Hymenobacter sp. ISL-91]